MKFTPITVLTSKPAKCFAIFLMALFLVLEFYVILVQKKLNTPLPMLFGNFDRVISKLQKASQKDTFSFAVMGDTRGANGVFEAIMDQLREKPVDFAVLLGDCANATEGEHNYFRANMATEINMPFPVFYIPGNHDVSTNGFTMSRFEELYGPVSFSFEYQGCLFIFLNITTKKNIVPTDQDSVAYLRTFLNTEETYRKIFVFEHVPPPIPAFNKHKFTAPEELIPLFKQLKVDYVFTGHLHGHEQTRYNGTEYIISGAGGVGADESLYKQFNHGIVMSVGQDHVSQRFLPTSPIVHWEEKLERFAFTTGILWIDHNRIRLAVLNSCVILAIIGICHSLVTSKRAFNSRQIQRQGHHIPQKS